jgi:protein-disulfide isomerase
MAKYEEFLEQVREKNPDEFVELIDILSRHKQLTNKNEELKAKQREYADELDKITRELTEFENKMAVHQTVINNNMSKQQDFLEIIDKEKSQLLA